MIFHMHFPLYSMYLKTFYKPHFHKVTGKESLFLSVAPKLVVCFVCSQKLWSQIKLLVLQKELMLGKRTLFLQSQPRAMRSLLITLIVSLHDDLAFFLSFSYTHWFISTCPHFSPGLVTPLQQPTGQAAHFTPTPTPVAWAVLGFL